MRMQARLQHSYVAILCLSLSLLLGYPGLGSAQVAPSPLLEKGKPPVDWWFVFKFNTKSFPACASGAARACPFGGTVQDYGMFQNQPKFGQQFISANSGHTSFDMGHNCVGDTTSDPVGATFDQVYNGAYNYVVWNDQLYRDPDLQPCKLLGYCAAPWAHSKGMLAWDDNGDGFVMQVSTPNWPGAGNKNKPRHTNGNSLGCMTHNTGEPHNNVLVSQHFFSVKLTKDDVVVVLKALQKASVVTARDSAPNSQSQLVKNGGPADIQDLVKGLGRLSEDTTILRETLSSGVQLVAKPPLLHVPPWHMISALLDQEPLIVATWWTGTHKLQDTGATTPGCWDPSLGKPGAIRNAESGQWQNTTFGLAGATSPDRNHAKLGVSKTGNFAIFGDFNNAGALSEPCEYSQNTRGGLFYVVENKALADGLRDLLDSRAPNPSAGRRNGP